MCEGVKINTLKSVACSRFQTIEKFEQMMTKRKIVQLLTQLRSTLCSRFLPATSSSNICRHCQKMTLSDKKKSEVLKC